MVGAGHGETLWFAGVSADEQVALLTENPDPIPVRRHGITEFAVEAGGPDGLLYSFIEAPNGPVISSGSDSILSLAMDDDWKTITARVHTLWDSDQRDFTFFPYDFSDWLSENNYPMGTLIDGRDLVTGRTLLELYAFGLLNHDQGLQPRLVKGAEGGMYFAFDRNHLATDVDYRVMHSTNLYDWQEYLYLEAGRLLQPGPGIILLPESGSTEIRIPLPGHSNEGEANFFNIELSIANP